eukprot:g49205.t1
MANTAPTLKRVLEHSRDNLTKIVEVESTRGIDANVSERSWSFDDPPRFQPQETEQTDEKVLVKMEEEHNNDRNVYEIGVDSDFDASPVVSSAPLATTVPSATHDTAPRDIDGNVGGQNIVDGKSWRTKTTSTTTTTTTMRKAEEA